MGDDSIPLISTACSQLVSIFRLLYYMADNTVHLKLFLQFQVKFPSLPLPSLMIRLILKQQVLRLLVSSFEGEAEEKIKYSVDGA